jgi:glutathione S-transferase
MTTPQKRRKVESQPRLKLYYFDIKGKGEPIRLMAAYAGLELEDFRISDRSHFTKMKENGELPFGQLPLLEVGLDDGTTHALAQSAAILRYVSKLAGLYPADDWIAAAKVDAALDQETDAFIGPTVVSYTTRFGIVFDDATKKASIELIQKDTMPRHLGAIESLLEKSSTGWIADTAEPSAADFVWFCRLGDYIPSRDYLFASDCLDPFPKCKAFCDKFMGLEEIKAYLLR